MISKYNSFIMERLFDSVINESIMYYSPKLRNILNKIGDNKVAQDLVELEATDVKPDNTFIDIDDKDGYFTFITMKSAKSLFDENEIENIEKGHVVKDDLDMLWDEHPVYNKSRNPVKIGRFVNKLLPGKHSSSDVEEFVNMFKAALEKTSEKFELVEGDDINKWYWYENYKSMDGSLGNSCMARKKNIFEVYVDNPDVCKLLILTEGDKLIGRALVWKLSIVKPYVEGIEYFMDRQYTILQSDVEKFRNYAKEQGWAYKAENNHYSLEKIVYNGEEISVDMEVQIDDTSYSRYPYMDTFKRYDNDGTLYNDESEDNEGDYILNDTGGGYNEVGRTDTVYSEWFDRDIDEEDAVWSENVDSYLPRSRAINVEHGWRRNQGWWPEGHDMIIFDEWNDIYIHVEDSNWCEAYQYYILDDDAIRVMEDMDSDGEPSGEEDYYLHRNDSDFVHVRDFRNMTWYDKLKEKFPSWENYDGVLKSELRSNWNGEWIPFVLQEYVYKVSNPDEFLQGVEYLTKIDAEVLGYELDLDDKGSLDRYEYNGVYIVDLVDNIKEGLTKTIEQTEESIGQYGQGLSEVEEKELAYYTRRLSVLEERLEFLEVYGE